MRTLRRFWKLGRRPDGALGVSLLALALRASMLSATLDMSLLQEIDTPDSGDDFIALLKPKGDAGRKIRLATFCRNLLTPVQQTRSGSLFGKIERAAMEASGTPLTVAPSPNLIRFSAPGT
jgi:hypothetical protein